MSEKQIALIVEDTAANRIFFERLLAQAGYEVISAETGKEALNAVSDVDTLALGVLDMQMPDISGLELTARLREKFADACLVVATMHDERSLMQSAFDRGCDVFLVKPHGFMELYKRLQSQGSDGLHANRPLVIDQYGPRKFQAVASR
jgi:two-component system KDP operon response regulator KdpE